MAVTYESIASTTLGSAATDITFSSISGSYTDLRVIIFGRGNDTATDRDFWMQFNGDTGSTNYSMTRLVGDGSTASSARNSSQARVFIGSQPAGSIASGTFGNIIVDIFNYANTTTYKTLLSRSNDASNTVRAVVGLWRKTPEAITSIKIFTETGNLASGTTAALYGIKAA